MKILIVIDSLGSGGAQRIAVYLAKGLVEKGHLVEIFVYNKKYNFFESDFKKLNIKIHSVQRDTNNKLLFGFKIIKNLRSIIMKYDQIISFMHTPSIYASISKFGIKHGKLLVFELSSSNAPVSKFKKLLFYLSCLLSNLVITNSVTETNLMKKKIGLKNKVSTIWNGYNIESMKVNYSSNSQNIKQLLIVGRIAYPKNGVNLLKGLKIFYDNNNWLPEVIWAGREDLDNRSLKMQKEMKIFLKENIHIANKFKFIGEVKNINDLYQSVDALIHPSIYEGLPNVICEAMILGCCVIASNVCDHPVILNDERGLLFDPRSPKSISKSIEEFNAMSLDRRNTIAKKARKFAEENFSLNHMIESFENLT